MLLVTTHTDHTFAYANRDILEMDATVQVQSIISVAFRFILTIIINFCLLLLLLRFCFQYRGKPRLKFCRGATDNNFCGVS